MTASAPVTVSPDRSPYDRLVADPRFQFALIVFTAAVLIFSKLGGNGLANYDDCFYAEKAKEILKTGDWMTMHYNGVVALENPPFYIWLIAICFKLFGVSEYAAKLPSALAGMGTVVVVYYFARYLFDSWTAFLSAIVMATTFIFIRYARHAMFDVTLTLEFTLALWAYLLAIRKTPRYFLGWGLGVSACILTKSVLGFFPLFIPILHLLLIRRWKQLFNVWFLAGCCVVVLLGCSWYIHQYLTFGRPFIEAHFGWLVLQRGFTIAPSVWYDHLSYLRDLLTNYWPWLPVLCAAIYRFARPAWKREDAALLLVLWIGVMLVLLSVMNARVIWYMMPIFPAAAILGGAELAARLKEKARTVFVKSCAALCLLVGVVVNFTPLQVEPQREVEVRALAPYVSTCARQGARVVSYKFDYYGLNNALLFYSDYAALPSLGTPAEVAAAFDSGGVVLCVVRPPEIQEAMAGVHQYHLLRATEHLALLANKPVDVTSVKTW